MCDPTPIIFLCSNFNVLTPKKRLKYFEDIKQHIFAQKPPISPKIPSENAEVTNDLTPQIIRKPIEKIMVRYRMYPKLMISPLNSTKLFTHQQADQQTYNWQVLRKVFDLLSMRSLNPYP